MRTGLKCSTLQHRPDRRNHPLGTHRVASELSVADLLAVTREVALPGLPRPAQELLIQLSHMPEPARAVRLQLAAESSFTHTEHNVKQEHTAAPARLPRGRTLGQQTCLRDRCDSINSWVYWNHFTALAIQGVTAQEHPRSAIKIELIGAYVVDALIKSTPQALSSCSSLSYTWGTRCVEAQGCHLPLLSKPGIRSSSGS